ncbi:hypothetical protein [Flexivirga meconopsidis]|uniref:hypothetical protein n=1 Tax=Flexivirga meconopsidis TaxID=2977121 RepID=UPI00223EBCC4|nr:hypothetical protein [Flexivirga meconopsidis]
MSQTTEISASAIRLARALVRNATKRGETEDPRIVKIANTKTPGERKDDGVATRVRSPGTSEGGSIETP